MIQTDEELKTAQGSVTRLEQVLLEARRTHTPKQYALLSRPLLLELQSRQSEILQYLMESSAPQGVSH